MDYVKPLIEAAADGDLKIIQKYIKADYDINEFQDSWVALTRAAYNGHLPIVQELLQNGADVNIADIDGWTALICAAATGHLAIVRELLQHGADVTAHTIDGTTALMIAWMNSMDSMDEQNEFTDIVSELRNVDRVVSKSSSTISLPLSNETVYFDCDTEEDRKCDESVAMVFKTILDSQVDIIRQFFNHVAFTYSAENNLCSLINVAQEAHSKIFTEILKCNQSTQERGT